MLSFPKNDPVRIQIKSRPGWEWLPEQRCWSLPIDALEGEHGLLKVLQGAKLCKIDRQDNGQTAFDLPHPTGDLWDHLRPYQRDGVTWASRMLRYEGAALLADEMGLGKTIQCTATLMAQQRSGVGPLTIVCPASVRRHWKSQLSRWWPFDTGFLVRGYEEQVAYLKALKRSGERPCLGPVGIDELHYLKNRKGPGGKPVQRTALIGEWVADCRNAGHPIMTLTGTPMTSRPRDLWNCLNLLWPGRFGREYEFQKRYCDGKNIQIPKTERTAWTADGKSNSAELAERLRYVMLRRTKAEVASDMPKLTRVVREIPMPKAARKSLMAAFNAIHLTEGQVRNASVGELLSRTEDYKIASALELAAEVLESGSRPLIVTSRKDVARQLANSLGVEAVTGDTKPDDRVGILCAGDGAAVATRGCIGTGTDGLQRHFDAMIVVGLSYVPAEMLQLEARLHRMLQDKPVTIYYLVGEGTIDEAVREVVIDRLETITELFGGTDETAFVTALRGGTDEELIADIVAFARSLV